MTKPTIPVSVRLSKKVKHICFVQKNIPWTAVVFVTKQSNLQIFSRFLSFTNKEQHFSQTCVSISQDQLIFLEFTFWFQFIVIAQLFN